MSIADKLQTIAENEQKIYDKGKQDEYDRFWDLVQYKGNRTHYASAFYTCKSATDFNPKYKIYATNVNNMFFSYGSENMSVGVGALTEDKIDFTNIAGVNHTFYSAAFTEICEIAPTNGLTEVANAFAYCRRLKTIKKLKLKDDGTTSFYNVPFDYCDALENLVIEGVIGKAGLNFNTCFVLSKASITSIINALSSTTSALSIKFSKKAVNKAFELGEGLNDGSVTSEWLNLIATKSNWTISLV